MVVARFDTSAKLKWVEQFGMPGQDFRAVGVEQAPSGDIYLGGYSLGLQGSATLPGADTYNTEGQNFDVVIRLDGAGNIRWITEIGVAQGNLTAGSLFADPTGGVYVGGTSSTPSPSGDVQSQFMLFTLDPNGYIQ
jgi:hypothetical protein